MRYLCILFLFCAVTTYSQTFYSPVICKMTLRVDGTVRTWGIPGTGSIVNIDADGYLYRGYAGAGTVTGLNPTEVLFGKSDGTIDQDPDFYYDLTLNQINLTGSGGSLRVNDAGWTSTVSSSAISVSNANGVTSLDGQYLSYGDTGGDLFKIGRTAWSTDMFLNFPAAKGTANQILKVGSVSGDDVNMVWASDATGTVTSIATTSPIGGGTITTTGTLNLLASGADKILYSTGVNTWAENNITSFGRDLIDDASALGVLTTLGIPTANTELLFGNGSGVSSSSDLTYDGTEFILGAARMKINASGGHITKYSSATPTDGGLLIGSAGSGYWNNGTITSSDITVGYSDPNLTLAISGLDATKIADGTVTSTEFQYINTLTSNAQTQLNTKCEHVGTPVNLTAQSAAIGATTCYTTPASDGFYQVNWVASITTAGTTSILGPFQVRFTNASDNVVKTYPTSSINFVNQTNANTTGSAIGGSFTVYCKASTDIKYIMGRTSTGTAMVYDLNIQIVKL